MASGETRSTGLFKGFLTGTALCGVAGVVFTLVSPLEGPTAPVVAKPEPVETVAQDLPTPPDDTVSPGPADGETTEQAVETASVSPGASQDPLPSSQEDNPVADTEPAETEARTDDEDSEPAETADSTQTEPAVGETDQTEPTVGETDQSETSETEIAATDEAPSETPSEPTPDVAETTDEQTPETTDTEVAVATPSEPATPQEPSVPLVTVAPSPRYLPTPDDGTTTSSSPFAVDSENPERVAIPDEGPASPAGAVESPEALGTDTAPVITPLNPEVAVLKPPVTDEAANPPSPPGAPVLNSSPDTSAPVPDRPAWREYAADFDMAGITKPLLSIVLEVVAEDGVALESIAGMKLPISFVVPSDHPEARQIAIALRASGHEVLVRPAGSLALTSDLTSEETRQRLETAFSRVPEVIGIIDENSDAARAGDLAETVLRGLAIRGHAAVTGGGGARNILAQMAEDSGIRHLTIGRVLDEERDAPLIANGLDRAAFTARNKGNTLVLGRTYPETMQAVISWALSKNNRQVTLAPASALMQ